MTTVLLCVAAILIPVAPVWSAVLVGLAYVINQWQMAPAGEWLETVIFLGAIAGAVTVALGW